MRYRLQRHDGTDCSATMVPITVLRMVPIQRYRHNFEWRWDNSAQTCIRMVYGPSDISYFENIWLAGNFLKGTLDGVNVNFTGIR